MNTPRNLISTPPYHEVRRGFTLVELLVVIAVMLVMIGLAVPAFNAITGARDISRAAYDVAGMLDQARAYAMAQNTYVYVGFAEVDASTSASASPQTPASATAGGRLAVAAVAAVDGTRGYEILSSLNDQPPNYAWTNYNNGANLRALGKLQRFEGIHLSDSLGAPPASGPMARPTVSSVYQLGNAAFKSVTPFAWPLGKPLSQSQCQYFFEKVIQFDPQGIARIQYKTNGDGIVRWIEIGLQQTHGNAVPPPPANASQGTQAAIQVDGMTGATKNFRP